ncbi:hypothetical protein JCM9140_2852 [Halalkalibacter wakoensis JCM 9140]|uniref:Uncharacterized protein n=1 Tax=Halalkalibacter wakoensis JCM 9140 TaxID=1236970 RepID=W4Q5V9_9BACI|nr:YhcN/YlaJ family sporulation lipoprotein [Halalkalibacter wakoensis]GAE26759.1 hypothetical protein JCM9140_2852 [Halalkalibacter wakoensis JCM 9140]
MNKIMISLATAAVIASGFSVNAATEETINSTTQFENLNTSQHFYHAGYEGETVQEIMEQLNQIEGVYDGRVIVHDNNVVIGLSSLENNDEILAEVEQITRNIVDREFVRVVTEEHVVERIYALDDRLRTGTPFDTVSVYFNDILSDLAHERIRPAEHSR